ncbi:MAG: hypothetical protein ACLPVY_19350 [Acidimicrobiia bacterium]
MDIPTGAPAGRANADGRPGVRPAPKRVARGVGQRLGMGAAWIAVLAYGWWFTDRQPFSRGAFFALVFAVGLLIAVSEVRRARGANSPGAVTRRAPMVRSAVVVWSAVSVAAVAWELIALRSLPRAAHPTISSLVESAEQYHLARLALYAVWMWLGWTLAS